MRAAVRLVATCVMLALAACSSTSPRRDLLSLLVDAPADGTAHLLFDGEQLVGIAVPTAGPGTMPPAVRTTLRAIAPDGETLFEGREWGPAGVGYRIEKRYRDGLVDHVRSVLIAEHGAVLERAHSVPLPQVPPAVLATGLQLGPFVDEARIVSDSERETHWTLLVRDRTDRTFVVGVGLDGQDLGHRRRLRAQLDG